MLHFSPLLLDKITQIINKQLFTLLAIISMALIGTSCATPTANQRVAGPAETFSAQVGLKAPTKAAPIISPAKLVKEAIVANSGSVPQVIGGFQVHMETSANVGLVSLDKTATQKFALPKELVDCATKAFNTASVDGKTPRHLVAGPIKTGQRFHVASWEGCVIIVQEKNGTAAIGMRILGQGEAAHGLYTVCDGSTPTVRFPAQGIFSSLGTLFTAAQSGKERTEQAALAKIAVEAEVKTKAAEEKRLLKAAREKVRRDKMEAKALEKAKAELTANPDS